MSAGVDLLKKERRDKVQLSGLVLPRPSPCTRVQAHSHVLSNDTRTMLLRLLTSGHYGRPLQYIVLQSAGQGSQDYFDELEEEYQ